MIALYPDLPSSTTSFTVTFRTYDGTSGVACGGAINTPDGQVITITGSNFPAPSKAQVDEEARAKNELWLWKREMSLEGHWYQELLHARPGQPQIPRAAARAPRPTQRSSCTAVRNFRAK